MNGLTEYSRRRNQLAAAMQDNAIAIIPGASDILRNGDAQYRFRQDSNFYYLTGFNEPDAILVVLSDQSVHSILFNCVRDPAQEQWTGRRLGQEGAKVELGMQDAFPIESFETHLPDLLTGKSVIYYPFGQAPHVEKMMHAAIMDCKARVRRRVAAPASICDAALLISEMRVLKSDYEIACMREAARISVQAHQAAMQACRSVQWEYELEAELAYHMIRGKSRAPAYDMIVGSGENACILHYTDNNAPLRDGDLVLIDAGAEYENYAADITRTFPVNGRFSEAQRAIYELVLHAQLAGIACIQPGVRFAKIQETIVQILTEGLVALDILKGSVPELIEQGAYKPYYMHQSGHWLGLDVHDAGAYQVNQQDRVLEAGMVLTVEPGLYLSSSIQGLDARWHNIGVRIEDDILVTPTGHDNLTAALPKTVEAIERLMGVRH